MITKDMILGDLLKQYPQSGDILRESGMHCLGCPSAQVESLEDACGVHGMDITVLLAKLNNM